MTSVAPAHRAAPHMTHTPDPDTAPQSQAPVSAVEPGVSRPRLRDQIAENPLLSLFGGIIVAALTLFGTALVALLLFSLNSINDRIDGLEAKVDAGFAAQGAQIAELDRKLTALVAHLNATEAVEAALEHRLLIPDAGATETEGEPPG